MASTAWSLLMLLLVLALIPLVLWTLKRLQNFQPPGRGPRVIELAGQLALGARERVVLVRVQDRLLVLGVTPQQVTLLAEAEPGAKP
ncbi:MAG TPA: flagellar biosynthetic protein FliO [Ramlibacter sp.]